MTDERDMTGDEARDDEVGAGGADVLRHQGRGLVRARDRGADCGRPERRAAQEAVDVVEEPKGLARRPAVPQKNRRRRETGR